MSWWKILGMKREDGRRGERRRWFFERKGKREIRERGRRGKEDEGPKQKGGKGKEKRGVGTEERKKEEGLIRIVFWNAGLGNKDDGF